MFRRSVLVAAIAMQMITTDRPLARVGETTVMYSDIACDRALAARNPQWLNGLSAEEACSAEEKRRFVGVLARLASKELLASMRWTVPDAAVEKYRAPFLRNEAEFEAFVAEAKRVPEAIARVYRGESLENVYVSALTGAGIKLDAFREEVAKFGSLEKTERYLARVPRDLRRSFEQSARDRATSEVIRQHIRDLAKTQDMRPEEVADELLETLVRSRSVQMLDDSCPLPPGRELFK